MLIPAQITTTIGRDPVNLSASNPFWNNTTSITEKEIMKFRTGNLYTYQI